MSVKIMSIHGRMVVVVEGPLIQGTTVDSFLDIVGDLLDTSRDGGHLSIIMGEVTVIDNDGIMALVSLYQKAKGFNPPFTFQIVNPSAAVNEKLSETSMSRELKVANTTEDAWGSSGGMNPDGHHSIDH